MRKLENNNYRGLFSIQLASLNSCITFVKEHGLEPNLLYYVDGLYWNE